MRKLSAAVVSDGVIIVDLLLESEELDLLFSVFQWRDL